MSVGRKLWLSLYPWERILHRGKKNLTVGRKILPWEEKLHHGQRIFLMGRKSPLVNFILIYENSLVQASVQRNEVNIMAFVLKESKSKSSKSPIKI